MISVLIATRNRRKKLRQCVLSIEQSTLNKPFEIVIIDQSSTNDADFFKTLSIPVRYYHRASKGKARAINFGLQKVRGKVVAFTDDDCVVRKDWLLSIDKFFSDKRNASISAVFGQTIAHKPERVNKKLCCPAIFKSNSCYSIFNPYMQHYKILGLGNNMAVKMDVFKKTGLFKNWLGVGSIVGAGGIESEFIFRMLINKLKISHCTNIVVFHDRWINKKEWVVLESRYSCGLMAFYFYYVVTDFKMIRLIGDRIYSNVHFINLIFSCKRWKFWLCLLESSYCIRKDLIEAKHMIRGGIIGCLFFIKDRLTKL